MEEKKSVGLPNSEDCLLFNFGGVSWEMLIMSYNGEYSLFGS
jgi:hypothetical protein